MFRELHVPQGVFAPTPTSDLLGNLVTDHAAPGLRVLDMGCGAGSLATAQSLIAGICRLAALFG
jgi:methylase of polypeptide subunit release factors